MTKQLEQQSELALVQLVSEPAWLLQEHQVQALELLEQARQVGTQDCLPQALQAGRQESELVLLPPLAFHPGVQTCAS